MKTTILTAALMILLTTFSVRASEETIYANSPEKQAFVTSVRLKQADIIEFLVINPDREKVTLKIIGERNNKIYQRTIKKEDSIRLGCDMQNFNQGTFVCVIEKNGFEVNRTAITLD